MKSKLFRLLAIIIAMTMIVTPANAMPLAVSEGNAQAPAAPAPVVSKVAPSETEFYIVRLADPALASYTGGIAGLEATSPQTTGVNKLDVKAPASVAYLSYLAGKQQTFIAEMNGLLGRQTEVAFQYLNVLNAMSVRISQAEAQQLAGLPTVYAVYPDTWHHADTDVGPWWINADEIWAGDTGSGVSTMGEGIIIGVIDTGINHAHPSFFDRGPVDDYDHTNPWGDGNYVGICVPGSPGYIADFCNDKLIGAYNYTDAPSAEDDHGHGSHTASTAGGNMVVVDVSATITRTISGVARHANIIAYRGLNTAGSGTDSWLVAAIDQGVEDGVHVLNYSISGGDDPWNSATDLAFLDAAGAGVFVSASAGNSGPGANTVAKTGPWNASVANTSHSRMIANSLDVTNPYTSTLQGLAALQGTSPVVLTADIEKVIAYDPTNLWGCTAFPAGYFTNKIALVKRGNYVGGPSCSFALKDTNVRAAGAVAMVVFNNVTGAPIVMGGLTTSAIPSVMITLEGGTALTAYIDAHAPVTARINAALTGVEDPALGDIVNSGSSRGPSDWEVLKPDYGAPGTNILAAVAQSGGDPVQYDFYSGTSMAAPHGAGAAALLIDLHPTWSPAEIKSAIASTAYPWYLMRANTGTAIVTAKPYDTGSGRINLADASLAGLVFDETFANYVAANPDLGGDPKSLNQPSLVNYNCVGTCTWTRTVKSVLSASATYTVSFVTTNPTLTVTANPAVFTIAAGATQQIIFTADVVGLPMDVPIFGDVVFETNATFPVGPAVADQHLTTVVIPASANVPTDVTINTSHRSGVKTVADIQVATAVVTLTATVDGLNPAIIKTANVIQDPTVSNPYNGDGTVVQLITVPAGALRLVAEVAASTSLDVDMWVGTGSTPSSGTVICTSATGAVLEYCNIDNPAAGNYWVLAQNFQASGPGVADLIVLSAGFVTPGDVGNLTVEGPTSVLAGAPFDIDLLWDEPTLTGIDRWYGVVTLGTSPSTPSDMGKMRVDLAYTQPVDIAKTAPASAMVGDVFTYTITLDGFGNSIDAAAYLTDTLPSGVTYAGGLTSSYGTAVYDPLDHAVYWTNVPAQAAEAAGAASLPSAAPANPRSVELTVNGAASAETAAAPAAPAAAVSLVLDDGSRDNGIGIGGADQFIFLNRFTPAPAQFPFTLNQVQVYFDSADMVNAGDDILIVIYENTSGNTDPAVGSNLLGVITTTVQAVNAWNVYNLAAPVDLLGPGDVLVGVVALEIPGTSYWPAAIDQTVSQQRSWAGWWSTPVHSGLTLPPDGAWILIDAYFPGNWMVRGYGETWPAPSVITITYNVTATVPGLASNLVELDYDGDLFTAQADTDIIGYDVTLVYHDLEDVVHVGEEVYVAGTFNGWNSNTISLTHDAGYTVFTTTLTLDTLTYFYKYIVKSGGDQWDWLNTGNRSVTVTGDMTVHDYRAVTPGYQVLLGPNTITVGVSQTTTVIQGEVYIQNVTNGAGAGRGVSAQLGYGTGSDLNTWTWVDMTYVGENGNNDIYETTITPTASGVFSYVVRFDGNTAPANPNLSWSYGDLDGVYPGEPFELENAGVLNVIIWKIFLPYVVKLF